LSFLLEESEISQANEAKEICILIKNKITEAKLCKITSSDPTDFVAEWLYFFNLFKYQCKGLSAPFPTQNQAESVILSKDQLNSIRSKIQEKLSDLKQDYITQKTYKKKQAEIQQKEFLLKTNIKKAKEISQKEVQKELRFEELMEEEELLKHQMQQEELKSEIKNNQKKSDKLLQAIKEKQLEEKYDLAKFKAVETIKKIKEETEKQILLRRFVVKKKFGELRKKNELKKSLLKEQIFNLRGAMAESISKVAKKGDFESCKYNNFQHEFVKIKIYCARNFELEADKYEDCAKEESFCGVCCENEFGELYLTEREICVDECEKNHGKRLF